MTKFPPLSRSLLNSFLKTALLVDLRQPLPFYRTPNPQLTYIFLLLSLWLLYKTWRKPIWKITLLSTAFGASLFSTYFYHATYFMFVSVSLFVFALVRRERLKQKHLIAVTTGLGMTATAYFFLSNLPQFSTLKLTGGVFFARYVDWIFTLRYGVALVFFWIVGKKIEKHTRWFLISLIVSAICVMNIQLFTGWTIQPGHWPQTTIEPTILLIMLVAVFPYWENVRFPGLNFALVILILGYGFLYQIRFVSLNPRAWSIPKDLYNVLQWLDENATTSEVVIALDVDALVYIPVLTKSNIFIPVEQYHYATVDEIWDRLIYSYKLYGFKEFPLHENKLPYGIHFELAYNVNKYKHYPLLEYSTDIQKQITNCYPSLCSNLYSLPSSVIDHQNERYKELRLSSNPYRLTYALYTPYERTHGASSPPGKLVFASGEYEVYKVRL